VNSSSGSLIAKGRLGTRAASHVMVPRKRPMTDRLAPCARVSLGYFLVNT